jgi:4a-hydroxytetrahydrobiopterin dehydratase
MSGRVSPEALRKALTTLPGWREEEGWLVREVSTRHWRDTVFLVNGLAALAEAHHHHPDLEVSYRKVVIRLHTHDAGGITEKDLGLARAIQDWIDRVSDLEPQEV